MILGATAGRSWKCLEDSIDGSWKGFEAVSMETERVVKEILNFPNFLA